MAPSKRNHVRQSLGEILGLSEKKPLRHEIGETSASAAADVVAVCVDNDSEPAVEMALNRLVFEGDHLKLIHVRRPIVTVPSPLGIYMPIAQVSSEVVAAHVQKVASETLDMLRSFQQMCNRKKVQAENIVLEDHNIPKAILKYISNSRVNKLVLMSSHPLIRRKLKGDDMPESNAMKASKFCSIYVVSKAKLASSKTKLAPVHPGNISPQNRRSCSLRSTLLSSEMIGKRVYKPNETTTDDENDNQSIENSRRDFEENGNQSSENNQSTENSRKDSEENGNQSFENNQSTENSSKDSEDNGNQSLENNQSTENSSKDSEENGNQSLENNQSTENSSKDSEENGNQSLENNQSTENSSKDSEENGNQIFENNQSTENSSKDSEENGNQIFENNQSTENSSKDSEESGNQSSENSSREFEENGNQSFRRDFKKIGNRSFENIIRDFEGPFVSKHKIGSKLERLKSDLIQNTSKTYRDAFAFEEAVAAKYKETKDAFILADKRCKGYSIEQIEFATDFFSESLKIGEGGYGPVYKGSLDHTTVAIKVLGKDAAQGRDEIKREIEVLSRIRHPNMLVLLGMCPEIGCIVYEYMDNCSLEEQLFHRGSGASLPWFIRFRIASEIASALHFLHTAKPKPIVHCDLKPANILLDHNFVSKIGDVGIASLVSPTVSCAVTDNKNSVSYMDPEYVRTGTLSPMSDLYALGIILLQLLTGKRPVALMTKVQTAILKGSFKKILDKTAGGWPLEETLDFANLALKCTEFLRRDRPDLETLVLPKLERFKDLAHTYAKHCTS